MSKIKFHFSNYDESIRSLKANGRVSDFGNYKEKLFQNGVESQHDIFVEDHSSINTFEQMIKPLEFPFDEQELIIIINTNEISALEITFESRITNQWIIRKTRIDLINDISWIKITIQRRCKYYINNIFFPTCIIMLYLFITFTLPITDVTDKLNISLTVILSIAASKFAISGNLPKTSVLNHIDKYFIICYLFMFMITICTCANSNRVLNNDLGTLLFMLWVSHNGWLYYKFKDHPP
jgi:hypothetical protein